MKLPDILPSSSGELDETPEHLKPARARFDLLHGAYRRAVQQRLALLTAVGVAATLLVFLAGETVRQTLQTAGVETRIERTEENIDRVTVELADLSQAGGLTEEEMRSYLRAREATVTLITGAENDLPALLDLLRSRKPDGVTINRMVLTDGDGEAAHGSVQLVVSLPNYDVLAGWMETLDTIPFFSGGADVVSWSGSPQSDGLTATIETPLTTTISPPRHTELENTFRGSPSQTPPPLPGELDDVEDVEGIDDLDDLGEGGDL